MMLHRSRPEFVRQALTGNLSVKVRQIAGDDSGVSLILAILVISIIVSVSLWFHRSMWMELEAAERSKSGVKVRCIAKSGYNYALSLLSADGSENDFDSAGDKWADAVSISRDSAAMFEEGSFDLAITDLSGRININSLIRTDGTFDPKQKALFSRFLGSPEFNIKPEEVGDILDAIKDWIDTDDEVTRFGAESGYYKSLEKPYRCRNGSLESIEEMIMIRGINRDLLLGDGERPGVVDFLTIYGDGKININTAHPIVLRAFSDDIDQEMVNALISYRKENEKELGNKLWYKNALGTEEEIFDQGIITTVSNHFEIESRGIMDNMVSGIKSVVKREGGNFIVMEWGYL